MTDNVTRPDMSDAQIDSQPQASDAESVQPVGGSVRSIADLEPGMQLEGKVKSITQFGAFIDLGVGPQGLVHISQMSRRRVDQVSDVVKVGDACKCGSRKLTRSAVVSA